MSDRRPQPSGASSVYASLASGTPLHEPTNPILAAVTRRKMTEKEVEALENRIKRLEVEEAKVKKSAMQARERSQQNTTQARAKRIAEERAQVARARKAEADRLKQAAQRRKEDQRQNLQRAFTGMYTGKVGDARTLRDEQERAMKEAARIRERQLEQSYERHDEIIQRRKEVSSRLEMQRIAHQEYLMQDFIALIQTEIEAAEKVEQEIVRLDQDEIEHIERIRQLQDEQRAAYERLERALGS